MVIVAQKKQNKNIGTTNLEGLNSRSSHNRMDHQKTSSTTQDKGAYTNWKHQKVKTSQIAPQSEDHKKMEGHLEDQIF